MSGKHPTTVQPRESDSIIETDSEATTTITDSELLALRGAVCLAWELCNDEDYRQVLITDYAAEALDAVTARMRGSER